MTLPFGGSRCAKCKKLMVIRLDNLPFCSECEKKLCEEANAKLKKIGGDKKVVLNSTAVQE